MGLGTIFLVLKPLGLTGWDWYGIALGSAALNGIRIALRYRVTVLSRSDRQAVIWIRWMKRGEEQEEVTPPVLDLPP